MGDKLLTVLYGSETGNSEAISKRIHQAAESRGIKSTWICFKDFRQAKLTEKWTAGVPVVIVVSSTGAGDPPENTVRFWRFFRKIEDKLFLDGVRFAMLGLGDTNYDSYQRFPNDMSSKLFEIGAKEFYGRGKADDGTGLEDVVEPWIEGLWSALDRHYADKDSFVPFNKSGAAPEVSQAAESAAPAESSQPTTPTVPVEQKNENNDALSAETSDPKDVKDVKEAKGSGKRVYIRKKDGSVTSSPKKASDEESAGSSPSTLSTPARLVRNAAAVDNITNVIHVEKPEVAPSTVLDGLSKSSPVLVPVVSVKRLTHPSAVKEVLHFELDLSSTALSFQPGDAFGIVPPNPKELVDGVITRLGLNGEQWVTLVAKDASKSDQLPSHIPRTTSIRAILTYYVDLSALPRRTLLRVLGEYATNAEEKKRLYDLAGSSAEEKAEFRQLLENGRPSLLDLLNRFPSVHPPLGHLLDTLPALQPRYYSLSNDYHSENKKIQFAFTVVKSEVVGSPFKTVFHGQCSHFLKGLAIESKMLSPLTESDYLPASSLGQLDFVLKEVFGLPASPSGLSLPIFARAKEIQHFHMPKEPSHPMIMIGPGTGVAPFRGFLQRRLRLIASGSKFSRAILFFGSRRSDMDFLYGDELQQLSSQDGAELKCAFSRESEEVVYVQHKMEECGETLIKLLDEGGVIYICGDASGMALGVRECWINLLIKYKKMTRDDAVAFLTNLQNTKRYLLDVWA